jgi:outer membrane autotransporter protein
VNVTSNNVLYSFMGNNLNGNITITPTLNPAVVPPGPIGPVFTALLGIAAQYPNSDIATVMAAVAALPTPAAIQNAVMQFLPIVDAAVPRMSFESAKQFQQLWALHMTNGLCVRALECDDDCYNEEKSKNKAKKAECEKQKNALCNSSINCDTVSNRWEVWADGFGLWGHQNKHNLGNSYNARLYGGMVGFQGPITREFSAGLGGGYARTHVERPHDNDSVIKMYDATAYLTYNPIHWYLDAAFSFDANQYEDARHIKFPGIDRTAKADYHGRQYTGLLASGYRFYKWCAIITPLASLQYSHLSVDGYHEHGATDLNLHVQSQHYNFLESTLGLKFARPIQTRSGVVVPEIHGLWLYDFRSDQMNLRTTLSGVAALAGSVKTKGPGLDRNRGDVGVGLTFIACVDFALEAVYNYQFSKRWHAHEALVKLSQRF